MHKEFKRLLGKAIGVQEYVIVINLDIRGFSSFCKEVNDFDVATYIKTVYSKILDEYFQNASYYKPAGDGLIIIIPFTRSNLKEIANSTVESCLNLLENFSTLCNDEPMVCFDTPNKIGMGIARGSACCIFNKEEDKVLDYSGRVLNLASRLMDMARPSGIVIDAGFRITLLDEDYQKLFANEKVYARGITTSRPITVHYTKKGTSIPDEYKNPPSEPKWETSVKKITYGKLKTMVGVFGFALEHKPLDDDKILIRVKFANPLVEGYWIWRNYFSGDGHVGVYHMGDHVDASLSIARILTFCESKNLADDEEVELICMYPIKQS